MNEQHANPGGSGLVGDLARLFSETAEEADAQRERLIALIKARDYSRTDENETWFRIVGAKTPGEQALVLQHFQGTEPHYSLVMSETADGGERWEHRPINPKASCLACAYERNLPPQELSGETVRQMRATFPSPMQPTPQFMLGRTPLGGDPVPNSEGLLFRSRATGTVSNVADIGEAMEIITPGTAAPKPKLATDETEHADLVIQAADAQESAFLSEIASTIARGTPRNVQNRIEDVRRVMWRLAFDSNRTEREQMVFRSTEASLALALEFLDRDEIGTAPVKTWLGSAYRMLHGVLIASSAVLSPTAAAELRAALVVLDELAKRKWPNQLS